MLYLSVVDGDVLTEMTAATSKKERDSDSHKGENVFIKLIIPD